MSKSTKRKPAKVPLMRLVPFAATPAGEPPPVRAWANGMVWTDAMLTALQQGVRGGRWHTLIDKVYKLHNLYSAADRVVANGGCPGVDHQTVEHFAEQNRDEERRLEELLRTGNYRPQAIRRTWIEKLGSSDKRPLGIPTVRDRVVQMALLHVIEPIFDITFADHSYGFRKGRGCHHALEHVERLLNEGHVYVVDADLKSYFDTIPHDRLMERVKERISDRRVLDLIQGFLNQGILDGLQEWTPEDGTPQGAVISPLLANLYLNPLDHYVAGLGYQMIRYADDFVILCRSQIEAESALEVVRKWVHDNGLTLHPTKTKIANATTDGFDFLGYTFRGELRLPRKKSEQKLKESLRAKTKRTNGTCMYAICKSVNPILRGWFAYFRHSFYNVYRDRDGWLRMRLRSILRKRQRKRGRGRGIDHQVWTNAYFAEHGLFSLEKAYERFCQSPRG